jgi:hypothetical protein
VKRESPLLPKGRTKCLLVLVKRLYMNVQPKYIQGCIDTGGPYNLLSNHNGFENEDEHLFLLRLI